MNTDPTVVEAPDWPTNQISNLYSDIGKSNFKRLLHFGPISAIFIIITVKFLITLKVFF